MKEIDENLPDFGNEIDEKTKVEYNNYIKRKKNLLADSQKGYVPFFDVYGPNGKMPQRLSDNAAEYDKVKIDIPEGMTEEMFTAIILGFAMDPNEISKYIEGNEIIEVSEIENYQMHMVHHSNILGGDHRDSFLAPHLIESRKKAKAAIDAYAKDKSADGPIKSALQNLINYSVRGIHVAEASTGSMMDKELLPEKKIYNLGQYVMDNNTFGLKPNVEGLTELNTIRLNSYSKQLDSMSIGESFKIQLIDNFEFMDQDELESYTEEMLFNEYIANMARIQNNKRQQDASDFIKNYFGKLGVDTDAALNESNKWADINDNSTVSSVNNTLPNSYANYSISDFDVILAQPDGKDKLRELYSEEIRKSAAFMNIVNSKNKADLVKNIMASDAEVSKGITSFKDVTLPNESEKLNKKYKSKLNDDIKIVEKLLTTVSYQSDDIFKESTVKYGFESFDHDAIVKMSKTINQLYKDVKSNNTWGGSKNNNFKNAMNKLAELNNFMFEAAKSGEPFSYAQSMKYNNLVEEFDRLSTKYLVNKKDINSTYAKNRVLIMGEAKKSLNASMFSLEEKHNEMLNNKAYELFGLKMDNYRKYDFKSPAFSSAFRGQKYMRRDGLNSPAGYSIFRDAELSVATMALINTGKYSLNDIMDPEKLKNEKRAMHEEVIQRMFTKTDANQKWIAKNIYDGLNNSILMIDEAIKSVNLKDPKLIENETFCKLINLAHLQFDAWQEMSHCQKEIISLAQKDHPEIKNYTQLKEYFVAQLEPLSLYRSALGAEMTNAAKATLDKGSYSGSVVEFIRCNAKTKYLNNMLIEYENSGKTTPLHSFFPAEISMKGTLFDSLGSAQMVGYAKAFSQRPDIGEDIVRNVLRGDITKNMKVSIDLNTESVNIEGLPKSADVIQSAETAAFLRKTDEALKRLENPGTKYKTEAKFLEDASYAIIGQIYRQSKHLPKNPATGEYESLETWRTKTASSKEFKNSLKSDGKLMKPKSVAAYAKNPEKIKSTIQRNNEKTMQLLEHNKPVQVKPSVPGSKNGTTDKIQGNKLGPGSH